MEAIFSPMWQILTKQYLLHPNIVAKCFTALFIINHEESFNMCFALLLWEATLIFIFLDHLNNVKKEGYFNKYLPCHQSLLCHQGALVHTETRTGGSVVPARPNSVNWIFYLEMNDLIVYTVQEISVSNGLQFQVCEIPEWPFHETSLNQFKNHRHSFNSVSSNIQII